MPYRACVFQHGSDYTQVHSKQIALSDTSALQLVNRKNTLEIKRTTDRIMTMKLVSGNIWKRDRHKERNLVVARRNSEISGLKKSNIQAVPDEQE